MIRPTKIPKFQSLSEAVDERYIQNLEFPVDENLMNETQAYMKASIFEFVGAEKIMKKLRYVMQSKTILFTCCSGGMVWWLIFFSNLYFCSHREDLIDISVADANVNAAGYLKPYCNLASLNLTGTLIWNWHTLADIVKQLPNLDYLNLSWVLHFKFQS